MKAAGIHRPRTAKASCLARRNASGSSVPVAMISRASTAAVSRSRGGSDTMCTRCMWMSAGSAGGGEYAGSIAQRLAQQCGMALARFSGSVAGVARGAEHVNKDRRRCNILTGLAMARAISARCRLGSSAPTTFSVMRSCKSKISSDSPSNRSAQTCPPVSASMSWPVTRTRSANRGGRCPPARTARRVPRPTRATSCARFWALTLCRACDHEQPSCLRDANAVKMSSTTPSAVVRDPFGVAACVLERQHRELH